MDNDENPYQAQFNQWERFYRTVVIPQQHLLGESHDGAWGSYIAQLNDPDVDIPITDRDEWSEDFTPTPECSDNSYSERSRTASETSSTFTAPEAIPSELCINNQMHNKYALSPETSAYANELVGIFNDAHDFGNVDDPENLRHTGLRDFCKSSIEDLRALPDPFPNKYYMKHSFE